jgi:hypothetical protein
MPIRNETPLGTGKVEPKPFPDVSPNLRTTKKSEVAWIATFGGEVGPKNWARKSRSLKKHGTSATNPGAPKF